MNNITDTDTPVKSKKAKQNNFTMIPNAVVDLNLSQAKFRLLAQIARRASPDKPCEESERDLAKSCLLSIPTIVKDKWALTSPRPEFGGEPLILWEGSTKEGNDKLQLNQKIFCVLDHFTRIPNVVFDLLDLSKAEFQVLAQIARRAGRDRSCCEGRRSLVKSCRMRSSTVTETKRALLRWRLNGEALIVLIDSRKSTNEFKLNPNIWAINHQHKLNRRSQKSPIVVTQIDPASDKPRSVPATIADQFGLPAAINSGYQPRSIPATAADHFGLPKENTGKKTHLRKLNLRIATNVARKQNSDPIFDSKAQMENSNELADRDHALDDHVAIDTQLSRSQPTRPIGRYGLRPTDAEIDQNNPDHVLDYEEPDFDLVSERICAGIYDDLDPVETLASVADQGDDVSDDVAVAVDSHARDRNAANFDPVTNLVARKLTVRDLIEGRG